MTTRDRDEGGGTGGGCADLETRLDQFVQGELPRADADAIEAHLAACDSCRALAGIVAAGARALTDADARLDAVDLTTAVLSRTSGPACRRAGSRLCDLADGLLADDEAELVRLHLRHCAACDALASTLASLAAALPAMAEIEPDAEFTADVLSASRARSGRRHRGLAAFGARLLARPRLALEGAYVGAMLLSLALGAPTGRTAAMLDFGGLGQRLTAVIADGCDATGSMASGALHSVAGRAGDEWEQIETDARLGLDSAWRRLRATGEAVWNGLTGAGGAPEANAPPAGSGRTPDETSGKKP
jgi:anti-sigma factor RsiW